MDSEDPLHQSSPPGVRWTTNNFAEALPGVPTPLCWGIWEHAITEAAFDVFRRFGAFSRRDVAGRRAEVSPVVGIFFGHVAGNIDLMSEAVARLPGFDPGAFEHQLFGLDPGASPVHRTRRRWPAVALRAPAAIAGIRRRLTRERADAAGWWRATTAAPIPSDRARAVLAESRDRFATMLAAHSMQSQLAQGAFDAITRTASDAGKEGLERHLVTGYGGVEETELARDLWAVSRDELDLTGFLVRHGFHGPNEGELSSFVWRENPAPVIAAAGAYAAERDERSPSALVARQDAERRSAEAELLGALPRRRRAATRVLLRVARRWIARRELGKAGFLQAIDGGRAAARVLGKSLAADHTLRDPADVFFLTYREVMGLTPENAGDLVSARRAQHEIFGRLTLPPVWIGNPSPVTVDASDDTTERVIRGVAVTPGRVVGRARVVLDAADCNVPVNGDEVLVTRTTDPSWVSMFLTAGGLAIDIGGPMSHGAIVARELGIPCVINTRDGTTRIIDGALVELDGDAGMVRLLD